MSSEPQYVDLQVNGYVGVDFNQDDLSEADLHRACERLRRDGVAGILATIITAEMPKMEARLARIAAIRQRDQLVGEVVWGIHIEGPFINETPGYVGVIPPHAARPADVEMMKRLLEAAGGPTRLVTLAPERDPGLKMVRYLADAGDRGIGRPLRPEPRRAAAAIDAGLSMFTHLGNGCPVLMHRHDNIIQRVLSLRGQLTVHLHCRRRSHPADGVGELSAAGGRRALRGDHGRHFRGVPGAGTLCHRIAEPSDRRRPDCGAPDGIHFMGSTVTMPRMVALLREELKLSEAEIQQLVSVNPRAVLKRCDP